MSRAAKVAAALAAVVVVGSWLPGGDSSEGPQVNVPGASATPVTTAPGPTAASPSLRAAPPAAADAPADAPAAADAPAVADAPAAASAPPPAARPAPPSRPADAPPLLLAASGGDGDSWRDTAGREYRLGMVNAPEVDECFGSEATAERRRLVAAGFRAEVYTRDRYGRDVAVVTTADGTNVNVHLARHGFADDRYLSRFRRENPALARQLDDAFAAARREGAGLWRVCRQQPTAPQGAAPAPAAKPPAPAGRSCHPDYVTCIPVKGDGSGRGEANDLDCGDLDGRVELRRVGTDPYRLDGSDDDGLGCE